MQYDRNQNASLILYPIPIKQQPEGTKATHSPIASIINEGDCYDAYTFVSHHCTNGSSHIQYIDFYQSYSPVEHAN